MFLWNLISRKDGKMKTIGTYFLIGLLVAIGGILFSDVVGHVFNGMDYGSAVTVGIGMYLCIVVVTCTGILVSKMKKEETKKQ